MEKCQNMHHFDPSIENSVHKMNKICCRWAKPSHVSICVQSKCISCFLMNLGAIKTIQPLFITSWLISCPILTIVGHNNDLYSIWWRTLSLNTENALTQVFPVPGTAEGRELQTPWLWLQLHMNPNCNKTLLKLYIHRKTYVHSQIQI